VSLDAKRQKSIEINRTARDSIRSAVLRSPPHLATRTRCSSSGRRSGGGCHLSGDSGRVSRRGGAHLTPRLPRCALCVRALNDAEEDALHLRVRARLVGGCGGLAGEEGEGVGQPHAVVQVVDGRVFRRRLLEVLVPAGEGGAGSRLRARPLAPRRSRSRLGRLLLLLAVQHVLVRLVVLVHVVTARAAHPARVLVLVPLVLVVQPVAAAQRCRQIRSVLVVLVVAVLLRLARQLPLLRLAGQQLAVAHLQGCDGGEGLRRDVGHACGQGGQRGAQQAGKPHQRQLHVQAFLKVPASHRVVQRSEDGGGGARSGALQASKGEGHAVGEAAP